MCVCVHTSALATEARRASQIPLEGIKEIWGPLDWGYWEPSSSLMQEQ